MVSSSSRAEICWRAQEKHVGNGKSMYNQGLVILGLLGSRLKILGMLQEDDVVMSESDKRT